MNLLLLFISFHVCWDINGTGLLFFSRPTQASATSPYISLSWVHLWLISASPGRSRFSWQTCLGLHPSVIVGIAAQRISQLWNAAFFHLKVWHKKFGTTLIGRLQALGVVITNPAMPQIHYVRGPTFSMRLHICHISLKLNALSICWLKLQHNTFFIWIPFIHSVVPAINHIFCSVLHH